MKTIRRLLIFALLLVVVLAMWRVWSLFTLPCGQSASPGVWTGAPAPKTPCQSMRMDSQRVIMRLEETGYIVEAVFRFFNSGDTRTERVGFPKRGSACVRGRLRDPVFVSFDTWVDGRKVEFSEDRDLMKDARSLLTALFSTPRRWRSGLFDRWQAHEVTFPARAPTTIRVSYEAEYVWDGNPPLGSATYIVGTASYWKDTIRNFSFTIDCSGVGGLRNCMARQASSPDCLTLITQNTVTYERRDFEPESKEVYRAVFIPESAGGLD